MPTSTSTNGFFWDSVNHDRVYDASSFEKWLKKFFTSGVFAGDLQVKQKDALKVTVGKGYCNIDGKVQIFESTTELTIAPGNSTYPRIDNVVVERNNSDRNISLKIVEGEANSTNVVPPERVWNDAIKQIVIARISVRAGATSITQTDISDTRTNRTICGIVAGTVEEMDFSQMQTQFDTYLSEFKSSQMAGMESYKTSMETSFSDWFQSIKNKLSSEEIGKLQATIDKMSAWSVSDEILLTPSEKANIDGETFIAA